MINWIMTCKYETHNIHSIRSWILGKVIGYVTQVTKRRDQGWRGAKTIADAIEGLNIGVFQLIPNSSLAFKALFMV